MILINLKERIKALSIKQLLLRNLWLKILSLGMAIITWLYVNGELTSGIKI
ncbi:MAG: hypothetical protein ABH858_03470 [Candidatus Omnitrophota bacterium]